MKLISSLLALVLITTPVAAMENDQAKSWLTRLSEALNQLNFNTSFVVVKNNHAEPYHWFHGIHEDGTSLEILALLNGPRRDVLRRGQTVSYIEPEYAPYSINAKNISGPIPAILRGDINKLAESYDFISVGRNRVLGRAAQLIRIVSKDTNRLGYWLWLDQLSGLPLKLAIVTRKGQLLEQIQFTHLEISEQPSESLKQLYDADLPAIVEAPVDVPLENFAWQVKWLPQGFNPVKADRHRIAQTKQPVEFMMFSDGLVDVSVYISKSQDSQRAAGVVMDGATVALNHVIDGYEVSVVGKIPAETAKIIADSVTFVKPTP